MSVRTLEVDGKTITALEGQTIFAAAWESKSGGMADKRLAMRDERWEPV